ncbi:25122_t:CDS:2, partial [Gigaspora rosea]
IAKKQPIRRKISEQRSKQKKPERLDLSDKMLKCIEKPILQNNLFEKIKAPNRMDKRIKRILETLPKLEQGQVLSVPLRRPRIERKFLSQRSYSPLSNELLLYKRLYLLLNKQLTYKKKKFREHTPTLLLQLEQGSSKIHEEPLSYDEITQRLELQNSGRIKKNTILLQKD